MKLSLGEIEALVRKAAKGAGYPWGLAEDAGKCVRYLCAAGLPGTEAIGGWLEQMDGTALPDLTPDCVGETWRAAGPLCPVITGTALCDRADMIAGGAQITLGPTAFPILLLPAIASASDLIDAGLSIRWPGLRMTRIRAQTWIEMDADAPLVSDMTGITITSASETSGQHIRRAYRGEVPADAAEILGRFAHRTYAPDTPESRLSGAGAGLTDND